MIGTFVLNTCPDITSIISSSLDFIIIDREHGRANLETTLNLLNASHGNCKKFVRVSCCDRVEIQKVLELKPEGILVPQISCFNDAKNAIEYSYYPPLGSKGLSPYTRAFNFSHQEVENKKKLHNKKLKLCLLIEGENGFNELPKILNKFKDNIHMVYFGLFDFANSVRQFPGWENKMLFKNLNKLVNECKKHNTKIGTIALNKKISTLD